MGAWGAGLYSSDMAADMRAVIKSALRLPFDEDRIVDILRDCERHAADEPTHRGGPPPLSDSKICPTSKRLSPPVFG